MLKYDLCSAAQQKLMEIYVSLYTSRLNFVTIGNKNIWFLCISSFHLKELMRRKNNCKVPRQVFTYTYQRQVEIVSTGPQNSRTVQGLGY